MGFSKKILYKHAYSAPLLLLAVYCLRNKLASPSTGIKICFFLFSSWNILQTQRDIFSIKNNILNYIVILAAKENEIVVKILIKEFF